MKVGILTGGGDCPGLNAVIRAAGRRVMTRGGEVVGVLEGWKGLVEGLYTPLGPREISGLLPRGGTILRTTRTNPFKVDGGVEKVLANFEGEGFDSLVAIGGEDTLGVAARLYEEHGFPVVGVPKTIDNDLQWTWRSFGFDTAVDAARTVLAAAHEEARGAWNGVGLVKLMGRHSGFIAAHAALASGDVNFCLVPEVRFVLEGPDGFLAALEARLAAKHHAVVVVAEGAGQELIADGGAAARDPSGNVKLKDIGTFLRDRIAAHFRATGIDGVVRYIDPSYTIRSLPTNSFDAQLCLALGQHAVHAGMAGRTDVLVAVWNQRFTHVPIPVAAAARRQLDPRGELWQRVLESTGQAV